MLRALGAIGLLAALAGCGTGSPAARAPLAVGCTRGPSYPGQRAGDCLAGSAHRFVVAVDGYEVLVGNWKRYTDDQGRHFVCAGVNVENLAPGVQPVSAGQFRLRTPAGHVETGQPAPSNGLASRSLSNQVQQGGGVCWPDPGTGGLYVGSFEPAAGQPRGVWTVTFLPG